MHCLVCVSHVHLLLSVTLMIIFTLCTLRCVTRCFGLFSKRTTRPLLLSVALKDLSLDAVRAVLKAVLDNRLF